MDRRPRVVFFGSGTFALPTLEALAASPEVELVAVVSAPDRPVGRKQELTPCPVAARARKLGLPLLQPIRVRTPESIAAIAALAPDLGVLADYGQIIPPALLDLPRYGILNVHPSLLPRWRGAAPIQATVLSGDAETGVAVILMDAGLDTGPIVALERLPVPAGITSPELEELTAGIGGRLLVETIRPWMEAALTPRAQDGEVSLTRPLRRSDGLLLTTRTAAELERQVRAYTPWPGSFVETEIGRLVVHRAEVESAEAGAGDVPGTLVASGDGLALTTADGRLKLLEVQPAGKKPMAAADLRRGYPQLVGSAVRVPASE